MAEKDDGIGLSLSLRCPQNLPRPLTLNLMQSPLHFTHNKSFSTDAFQSYSADRNVEARSYLRRIDVNRPADWEEERGGSSPNSTVSSVSGKRSEREENDIERSFSFQGIGDEDDGGGERKKLRLTKEQSAVLEGMFKEHSTLNPKQKVALAKQLNLRPRQVEVWFQNRRARTKLKQTEVDCEYLKKCCENLTDKNKRLQKEVNELRALKLSPEFYMQMKPPTTLAMCPSCERVAAVSSSSSFSAAASSSTLLTMAPTDAANARRHNPVDPSHHRPVPTHPWATKPVSQPLFDAQPAQS